MREGRVKDKFLKEIKNNFLKIFWDHSHLSQGHVALVYKE